MCRYYGGDEECPVAEPTPQICDRRRCPHFKPMPGLVDRALAIVLDALARSLPGRRI